MQYKFFGQIDPGLVRTNNEDAFVFDESFGVGVLADGMGGYSAGEVASAMATEIIKSELVRWLSAAASLVSTEQVMRAVEICASQANRAILTAAMSNPAYAGMGTTLVVGIFHQDHLVLGHVGDSRCYRLRQGALLQLTKDHSMLQEQVDAGLLTRAQAAVAPGRNLLTRALGVEESLHIDVAHHAVEEGDIYLMCTDGLTDMLVDWEIEHILKTAIPLAQIAQTLVTQANAHGGRDNIGVLLVQAAHSSGKKGLMSKLFGKS